MADPDHPPVIATKRSNNADSNPMRQLSELLAVAPPAYGQQETGASVARNQAVQSQSGGLYRQLGRPGSPVGRAASPSYTTVVNRVRSRSDGDEALEESDDDEDCGPCSFPAITPPRRRSISQSSPASGAPPVGLLSSQTPSELTAGASSLFANGAAGGRPTALPVTTTLSPPSPVRAASSSSHASPLRTIFLDTVPVGGLHGLEIPPSPGSLSAPLRPQLVLTTPTADHTPPVAGTVQSAPARADPLRHRWSGTRKGLTRSPVISPTPAPLGAMSPQQLCRQLDGGPNGAKAKEGAPPARPSPLPLLGGSGVLVRRLDPSRRDNETPSPEFASRFAGHTPYRHMPDDEAGGWSPKVAPPGLQLRVQGALAVAGAAVGVAHGGGDGGEHGYEWEEHHALRGECGQAEGDYAHAKHAEEQVQGQVGVGAEGSANGAWGGGSKKTVRFALVGKVPEREFLAHAMLPINHQVRVAGGRMASGARAKQDAQVGGAFARVMATVRRVRKQRQRAAKQRHMRTQGLARAALQAGWLQQQNAAAAAPRAGGGLVAAQKG